MEIKFKKVHTAKDLIISTLILLAGIGLFFVSKGSGIAVAIIGIILLITYKSGYQKEGDTTVLQKGELELSGLSKPSLLDFLDGKPGEPKFIVGHDGGTVLMEIWYNKRTPVAYARLLEYREQTFQPITDIIELKDQQAQFLISKL